MKFKYISDIVQTTSNNCGKILMITLKRGYGKKNLFEYKSDGFWAFHKAQNRIFGLFLGPNNHFLSYSHTCLCPTGHVQG